MEHLSVLVVDQDPTVRAALARLLKGRGNTVVTLGSRAEAFDVLDSTHFDLLILDDPAQERCYRMVWLTEDVPDIRVELLDLDEANLAEQLETMLQVSKPVARDLPNTSVDLGLDSQDSAA
ncbi:MAG: response regulator [Planctomycetes bacterium]|nr:response regulator [Planctomycetota bacterium]